jgi:hypothetical protein
MTGNSTGKRDKCGEVCHPMATTTQCHKVVLNTP